MNVWLLKFLDATVGGLLCWVGGYWLHWVRRESGVPSPVVPADIRRILVIRPGGMGDMVLLLPMLKALRQHYLAAAIDLVCERRNREIPGLAGDPAELLLYDAHPLQTVVRLIRRRYDLTIDTEQFHYFSAVMTWFSGAPVRIGFKINPGRNPLYTHLINYDLTGYEATEFMRLLGPLGVKSRESVEPCSFISLFPLPAHNSRLILIHVAASTRYKHWAPEKFAELARRLSHESREKSHESRLIVLVGGKKDKNLAETIARLSGLGEGVKVLAGEQSLSETAALIRRAELFIGGDSGLAHLAAALGTPTVVLFGPSDPAKWGARGPGHAIVRKELACSPCFIFGYHKPCHSIACMAGITVDDVLVACGEKSGVRIQKSE